jgi:peptide deformylase
MSKAIILDRLEIFKKAFIECPELVYVGEKSLREILVDAGFVESLEIIEKLKITLLKYRGITGAGRGLAAPQIGINKRIFITYIGDEFQIYVNPEIVWKSEKENFYRELCMSSGIMSADVKRSEKIKLEWLSEKGEKKLEEFEGFVARLLQHEYGHLDGIVNLDCCEKGSVEFVINNPLDEKLRDK